MVKFSPGVPSCLVKRIKQRNAQRFEVPDITGYHRQVVLEGGRRNQQISAAMPGANSVRPSARQFLRSLATHARHRGTVAYQATGQFIGKGGITATLS